MVPCAQFISTPSARGKHQAKTEVMHESSHRSIPTRTTLPRNAPPRCPAPVLLGEYHYKNLTRLRNQRFRAGAPEPCSSAGHCHAVYLPGQSASVAAGDEGALARGLPEGSLPVVAHNMAVIVPDVPIFNCQGPEKGYACVRLSPNVRNNPF